MDLFSEEMRRNPFPMYERLRAVSPVLHVPQFGVWMIFDYEGVRRAINDLETFSSAAAPGGGKPFDWLIFSDPPRHTKLRAIIMRAFTPGMVANLEPRIRQMSRELLDPLVERGAMDLAADYAVPLPIMVIAEMLGIPLSDREKFKRWSDAILRLANTITGGEEAARAANGFGTVTAEMNVYLDSLLHQRRTAPRDDLLTRLVQAEVDGQRLTSPDILGFFQLLLLAGSETTTNLISNAILCFIEHPDQLRRLQAAPELLPAAIEEVLRFRSPVQAIFRQTTRDVAVGGETIPRGQLVLVMIGSANRDPCQFKDAEFFDIGREPNQHLAFGHGPHFCIGAPLARLESRVALTDLLSRMNNITLASNEPWPPRNALHVYGPTSLPIRFELNQPVDRLA
jgi:cytochrome P450